MSISDKFKKGVEEINLFLRAIYKGKAGEAISEEPFAGIIRKGSLIERSRVNSREQYARGYCRMLYRVAGEEALVFKHIADILDKYSIALDGKQYEFLIEYMKKQTTPQQQIFLGTSSDQAKVEKKKHFWSRNKEGPD